MRTVATIVLISHCTLIVSPAVQAMQQQEAALATQQQAARQMRDSMGDALGRARERLRTLAEQPDALGRRPKGEDRRAAKEALRASRAETAQLAADVRAEFAATEEVIRSKGLPEVLRQRHAEAVARFESEMSAFDRDVDAALTEAGESAQKAKAQAAYERLSRHKLGRSQQKFDPNSLPNTVLKPDRTRVPKTTPEAFQAALLSSEDTVQFAQAAPFDFSQLPGAGNPDYLAASVEVVLGGAIQAKADELHHNPVEIYNWVRNNVQWQPTWGAIQNASHTLASRRGNAFDIASLMIALLRASGIPARYAYGTIEVPEDKFRNWAGGFQHIDAALDFVSAGGIPVVSVTTGGRVTKVRLEHVWVEAAADFNPSRGVKNRSADSWVGMDPSFKQLEIVPAIDDLQVSGLNAAQIAQEFTASGTSNPAEGWVAGFNTAIVKDAQRTARTAVQSYVQQNNPDATMIEVFGGRRIVQQQVPVLSAGLRNRVVALGARFASVPASLQQQITFGFGRDIFGDAIDARTFPWAQLNNRQVTLSFRPASAADEAALAALLPQGDATDISQLPSSIPAYLIQAVPELKVDSTVVLSGPAMALGTDLNFVFAPRFVGSGDKPFSYTLPAGSYLAVAVVAGSIDPAELAAAQGRLQATRALVQSGNATQIRALTRERSLGDMFQAGLLSYYMHYVELGQSAGQKLQGYHQLAAGVGSFGFEPNVDTFFGVPRRLETGGVAMNIPIVNVVGKDSAAGNGRREFTMMLGALSSMLEHAVPEQIFGSPTATVEGISAIKALSKASAAGQRIYEITPANQGSVLPLIHHDAATMDEIGSALAAGKTVYTHTDAVSVPGWSGAGYVLMDHDTGAAAWKIAGGANGGFLLIGGAVLLMILALFVANPVLGILLLAGALLLAGCGLSMLYEDDRFFDVYAFMAVALVGALIAEVQGINAILAFLIPGVGLELPLILSNLDDKCANGSF